MTGYKRQLHIGLSLTATWLKGSRSDNKGSSELAGNPGDFYVGLAQAAEKAKLDFVFRPDYLMHVPVTGSSPALAGLDPMIMLTAIARETNRIGLVTTASTTFNPPYVVARQIQSMHWISKGRAGWNIVTSIEGAENFGEAPMPPPEVRYRKAAEFTDVVRRLWRSYPPSGLADAGCITPIDHAGEFFSVKGPLNVPGFEAGPPPLFQAGASEIGRSFAASVADATFASTPDMAAAVELRGDLRRRAESCGRGKDAVRVLPGLYFFLAKTKAEARDLHDRAHSHLTRERRCASVRAVLGLDVEHLSPATRVTPELLPPVLAPVRSRTHADLLRRFVEANHPTVDELLSRPEVVGSAHWVSVGTVGDVINDIVEWFEAGAMDGFIAIPGGSISSLNLFLDELVPALAERGIFRKDYEGDTLRDHLRVRESPGDMVPGRA